MFRIYPNEDPYIIEVNADHQSDGDALGPFMTFVKAYTRLVRRHVETVEFLYNYKIRYDNYKIQFMLVDSFRFYVYFNTPLAKDEVTKNVKTVIRILNKRIFRRQLKEMNEWHDDSCDTL